MLIKPPPKEFTEEMKKQKQDADGQTGKEIEITPAMIQAGRRVFDDWMAEWNYWEGGFPGDAVVDEMIASILACTFASSPVSDKNLVNRFEVAAMLLAEASKSATV